LLGFSFAVALALTAPACRRASGVVGTGPNPDSGAPAADGGPTPGDGAARAPLACPAGFVACGGACIDPASSTVHCGASGDCTGARAGASCAAGSICAGGACTLSCPTGLIVCSGVCTDPLVSPTHCGASGDCTGARAGQDCGADEGCLRGSCVAICGSGLSACGSACVDFAADPANCGGCGQPCPAGQACLDGQCSLAASGCSVPVRFAAAADADTLAFQLAARGGAAAVAWGGSSAVWLRRFEPATLTWGAAEKVADLVGQYTDGLVIIGFDAAGAAVVGWDEDNGRGGYAFRTSLYDAASGAWRPAEALFDAPESGLNLAMADDGSALALGVTGSTVVARRHLPGAAGWSAAEIVANLSQPPPIQIQVPMAVAPGGAAVIVWTQGPGAFPVEARRLASLDGAWSDPEVLSPMGFFPTVTMDARGDAIAIWAASTTTEGRGEVWTSRFDATAGVWSAAAQLGTGLTLPPLVAMDDAGDAWMVDTTPNAAPSFWSDQLTAGAWGSPSLDANGFGGVSPTFFVLAASPEGGAALAFSAVVGSTAHAVPSTSLRRWDSTSGTWDPARVIHTTATADLQIAMLDGGVVLVGWPGPWGVVCAR
jgi:hypothetical protein